MDELQTYLDNAIIWQQELEKIPELAWHEQKTSRYIQEKLGLPLWQKKTALVYGVGNGTPVIFRAELDALNTPVGPRHVCGHSAHLAALMAIYTYIKIHPVIGYTIYFIFQPCEESFPSGADFVMKEYAPLKDVRAAFAFHSYPSKKIGQLFNPIFAGGNYFEITVEGKSTHIKNKYEKDTVDAVYVAAQLVRHLNTKKFSGALINVGTILGGESPNSIAGKVVLSGDLRYLSTENDQAAQKWLSKIIDLAQRKYHCAITLYLNHFAPLLMNDDALLKAAKTMLPITRTETSFATEDFALYPMKKLFLLIGTGSDTELHENDFVAPHPLTQQLVKYWVQITQSLAKLVHN